MTAISQDVSSANAIATHRLRDALAAAALTFFLCFPIILLHAEADNDGNLYLTWRPWAVVILCAIAFVGRYALLAYGARPRPDLAAARVEAPSASRAFITRYIATVDQKSLGLHVSVFISIKLARQKEEDLNRFARAISKWDEVLECYLMTGNRDYLLRVVAADLSSYEAFLKNKLTRLDGIASIESSFALSQVKYSIALPVQA